MLIVPAILEKNKTDFLQQIKNLSALFSHFQIDIADGQFVPNKTVSIQEIGSILRQSDRSNVQRLTFDFHLMVNDLISEINKLNELAAENIKIQTVLIHLKTFKDSEFINHQSRSGRGIVLNPEDQVGENWGIIKDFPVVQIMSVQPGFQGSPFLPDVLNKISQLRQLGFRGKIYLDGGVNDQTLPLIIKNQPLSDVLCVGSYLKSNPQEKIMTLQTILKAI